MSQNSASTQGAHGYTDVGALKDAPSPFNKATANIVLHSVDSVAFRVREGILAEASSVFEDMFSLPTIPEGSRKRKERDDQEYLDDIPIIPVTETARTLDNLLRFCYPVANPKMKTADEICEALEAAKKYFMEQAEVEIKEQFAAEAEGDPFTFYALAARQNWAEEMKVAAKACLFVPFPVGTWVPEMRLMGAAPYMHLQVYHKSCADVAGWTVLQKTEGPLWHCASIIDDKGSWFKVQEDAYEAAWQTTPWQTTLTKVAEPREPRSTHMIYVQSMSKEVKAASWIIDYLQDIQEEVRMRPRGRTIVNSMLTARYATSCSQASGDLRGLCDRLSSSVEAAVSRIQLEVEE